MPLNRLKAFSPAVRRSGAVLIGVAWIFFPLSVLAADPQSYTVTIKPTGNAARAAALSGSSTLVSLRESAPVAGFALVQRARQDEDRFTTALQSYGFYKATIHLTIGGH